MFITPFIQSMITLDKLRKELKDWQNSLRKKTEKKE